jgi:hypothetical protein
MALHNMNDALTLMHLSKPFQDASLIIDAASTENELLLDIPSIACNRGQVHEIRYSDQLPKPTNSMYHMGVKPNNTQILVKKEGIMMSKSMVSVNKRMVDDSGDKTALLNFESRTHIEGMGRHQAWHSIYGDKNKDPTAIDGFATRVRRKKHKNFVSLPLTVAGVETDAGDAPVTTLYIAAMGGKGVHYLYNPSFGNIGVKKTDKGEARIEYADGSVDWNYEVLFEMEWGVATEHPDSLWAIGNISPKAIKDGGWDGALAERFIEQILHIQKLLPRGGMTHGLYANLDVIEMIEWIARKREFVVHPETDPWGRQVSTINGMRVRRMDVIPTDISEKVRY